MIAACVISFLGGMCGMWFLVKYGFVTIKK